MIIIGAIVLKSSKNKEAKPSEIDIKFEKEIKQLKEFNAENNFLANDFSEDKINKYVELLLDRFNCKEVDLRHQQINSAQLLIPSYIAIIHDFKKSITESKYQDEYKNLYHLILKENKSDMGFVSVFSLVGLELLIKIEIDAKQTNNTLISKKADQEITKLNALLNSIFT
ncbi:hypothetical protein [Chondrinema litorale]|uniref:hypothetical protein n=1 Tax=Chondrinema litorale TaxID=2994555 RepID=UPI0025435CD8|nr:hypothetical protein [Chondrinema litorale]UZR97069.1 hypothetical protein OQ292_23505 [Chondrinema litorale]